MSKHYKGHYRKSINDLKYSNFTRLLTKLYIHRFDNLVNYHRKEKAYLTNLDSSYVSISLLKPYDKSQIVRVVAALMYLNCNVFVWVAAWNTADNKRGLVKSLIYWQHSTYNFTLKKNKKLMHAWIKKIVLCGRIFHRLYWISTTPRANREAAASVFRAILPKARWLRMKSVLWPEPWSVITTVTPLPEHKALLPHLTW